MPSDSSVIVALVTPEKYSEWISKNTQNYGYFHILDLSFYEVANTIEHKVPADLIQGRYKSLQTS